MYSTANSVTKNIYELQSDILAEKLNANPYMPYHVLVEKNKQLNTNAKSIVGAINELLRRVNTASNTNKSALAELYNVLGHVGAQPKLIHDVLQQAPSLIELVLSMIERLDNVEEARNVLFKDQFYVEDIPTHIFKLSHTPKKDTLRCFVNGVQYYNNSHKNSFTLDVDNLEATWIFTETLGGFDIRNAEVVWEYTYDLKKELEQLSEEEEG